MKRSVKLALFLVVWFSAIAFAYFYFHSPTPNTVDTVKITILQVEHGAYSPAVGTYTVNKGSNFAVQCYPDAGYTLKGYQVSETFYPASSGESIIIVMNGNKTVKGVIE